MPPLPKPSQTFARLWRVEGESAEARSDQLATEEPLEIRLLWQGERHTVAVTMRTPGADGELAVGFLHGEGIVERPEHVRRVGPCLDEQGATAANIVEVEVEGGPEPQWKTLERHFFSTSACGVCGKAGLETLTLRVTEPLPAGPQVRPEALRSLPEALRRSQSLFESTGGLHAAGLFDPAGSLLAVREDVGRHNAVDKLLGWAFLEGLLPLHGYGVMVSGRSSYEILQKCLVAGVPIVCAVSAPSSLAVDLASRFGITLVGFLRGERFNVYSGIERIEVEAAGSGLPPSRRPLLPISL